MKRWLGTLSMAALPLLSINTASDAFNLPDSGQTKCYQQVSPFKAEISCAGTGQDPEHIIHPMNYTDNGNGTIMDNNTGLMWQKCSVGQNNDATCSGTASALNWYQASGTFDATYNPTSSGACGSWRLPTVKELITIVDFSVPGPAANSNATFFPNTVSDAYWLADEWSSNTNLAWFENFYNGLGSARIKTNSGYVRCVLGAPVSQNYTDNRDGTETDNATRLVWQKCSAGQSYDGSCSGSASLFNNWNDALGYCNNLSLASQTDWRLPNIKEIDTLLFVDPEIFPKTNAFQYWSSTTYAGVFNTMSGYAFMGVADNSGIATKQVKALGVDMTSARCVRGGQSAPSGNPVRLMRNGSPYDTYLKIQDAYTLALDGDSIQTQGSVLIEILTFAKNSVFSLQGGYTSDFVLNQGMTTLHGTLTISSGTATLEDLIIQ
ncbi:MAG: DUF1566 domain-containing protein [Desulfuromonadales bacterium]|nr:DUF1566 domain-containing protein [Desulfuromonadales bacterium]